MAEYAETVRVFRHFRVLRRFILPHIRRSKGRRHMKTAVIHEQAPRLSTFLAFHCKQPPFARQIGERSRSTRRKREAGPRDQVFHGV